MSKSTLRAALAAAVIAIALGGLLVLGSGSLREQGRGESREKTALDSSKPASDAGAVAPRKDAKGAPTKPAGPAPAAPAAKKPARDGDDSSSKTARTSGESSSVALSKEPTRDEILAGLARGEPGFELLASRLPVQVSKVEPTWREGDEWLVDTWYRQMQAPGEPWAGPTTWRFKVTGETSFRDLPCQEIVVTRVDDPAADPTVFYVTRDHKLAGVRSTVQQQGKQHRIVWAPDDESRSAAMQASLTIVPFELPAHGSEARVLPPGLSNEAPLPPAVANAGVPAADALVGHGKDVLELEFDSPKDGTKIYQRWSPADPRWPVYSRTQTTLSFRRER